MYKKINYNFIIQNPIKFLIITSLLILAIYLSYIGGYGSDEDTLPMIGVFLNYFKGNIMTSRFTGYPVPEFGIGFLSYYFGSFVANLVTFYFCFFGLILFYLSISNDNKMLLFIILALSNPFIFFDNLEPIDYSWAFFFLSLGMYSLVKKRFDLACVFFGLSIGSRINFLPFVFAAIIFLKLDYKINYISRIILFISSFFVGGLFYLTVWIQSGLTLDWLTAARPYEQGIFGYLARFSYKSLASIGLLQCIIILFYLWKLKKLILKTSSSVFIIFLIISNLIIFFYIPAEISYLQPFIISLYFLLVQTLNKKTIYLIIILNFFSWFINYDYLKITYENKDECKRTLALEAKFEFNIHSGYFKKYVDSRNKILCWVDLESEYGQKISKGLKIKD